MFARIHTRQCDGKIERYVRELVDEMQIINGKLFQEISETFMKSFQGKGDDDKVIIFAEHMKVIVDMLTSNNLTWGRIITLFSLFDYIMSHLPTSLNMNNWIWRNIDSSCSAFFKSPFNKWEDILMYPLTTKRTRIYTIVTNGVLLLIPQVLKEIHGLLNYHASCA